MSSMPGLKMFFRQFDRRILKRFFERHDASFAAEIDWEKAHPQLADGIYDALSGLRERDETSFQRIYATLTDINGSTNRSTRMGASIRCSETMGS